MDNASAKSRRGLSFIGTIEVISILLCAATITGFLARLWWIFELTCHFRFHLAVLLAVVSTFWFFKRRRLSATVCGAFAVINFVFVLKLFWPDAQPMTETGERLRVAVVNVNTANERTDLVLRFLERSDPDVILLMEVDERWMGELSPLRNSHPHVSAEPRDDNFGIALFSRIPLTNETVIELGSAGVPSIAAEIEVGPQKISILGTHPLPPGSAEYARLRNEQFRAIAMHVRTQSNMLIVLGDLNATPWSPHFADLLRETGLKNTSQGRGLYGTWPAWLPLGRIPLDHGLVSPALSVVEKRVGSRLGSDHLPLMIELSVPREGK